jgi:hypothetical protein
MRARRTVHHGLAGHFGSWAKPTVLTLFHFLSFVISFNIPEICSNIQNSYEIVETSKNKNLTL